MIDLGQEDVTIIAEKRMDCNESMSGWMNGWQREYVRLDE